MRCGFFLAAAAALAVFTPAATVAADPAVVYQTQPIGRVLDDARATIGLLAGDKSVESFNKEIKSKLGDKGFLGLDINRPVLGYIDVTADLTSTVLVLALPMTNEKDFLDFCERWNKSKPKALKDGLYELPPLNSQLKAVMRVSEGYAYIATGVKDPARALDAKSIVPTAKLYDPTDISLAAGRVYFDRIPKEVREKGKEGLEQFEKMIAAKGGGIGMQEKIILDPLLGLAKRALSVSEGAKEAALRLDLNPGTADFQATLTVTPIAGSPLEKVIGGMKPPMNAFADLVTPDAAAGLRLQIPFDIPEVRDSTVKGLEFLQKEAANNAFGPVKPIIDELLKGSIRTVKAGPVDVGVVVRGPDRNGAFTGVAAITFDDPSGVEKEFKKFVTGNAPADFQQALKWDAVKVNGVSIHTLDLSMMPGEGPSFVRMFGQNATMAFAFAPKAYYQAIGPDPIGALKSAMALKPGPAPHLQAVVNPSRLVKLVQAADPQAGAMVAQVIGTDDKLTQALALSVSGGKELIVKLGFNGTVIGKLFMFSAVSVRRADEARPARPVPPPPLIK